VLLELRRSSPPESRPERTAKSFNLIQYGIGNAAMNYREQAAIIVVGTCTGNK
jgi:hypothetical protein